MEENTNIDVLEENKENYLRSFEYAKAQVNVLDEVPQSYAHQGNPQLDQTKYIAKTKDHESMDFEVTRSLSKTFYEGHVIMDFPLYLFTLEQV